MKKEKELTLLDTVNDMTSSDYRARFKAEYQQLKIRYEKLTSMLSKWDNNELNFKPTCPRKLYTIQARAMFEYLAVLETRALIEGVVLNEQIQEM